MSCRWTDFLLGCQLGGEQGMMCKKRASTVLDKKGVDGFVVSLSAARARKRAKSIFPKYLRRLQPNPLLQLGPVGHPPLCRSSGARNPARSFFLYLFSSCGSREPAFSRVVCSLPSANSEPGRDLQPCQGPAAPSERESAAKCSERPIEISPRSQVPEEAISISRTTGFSPPP